MYHEPFALMNEKNVLKSYFKREKKRKNLLDLQEHVCKVNDKCIS